MRLRSPGLLLLLLSSLRAGARDEEVRALVGSEVLLGCRYPEEKSFDLKSLFVYWQIHVAGKVEMVTFYLSGNSSAGYHDNQYKNRARLALDRMQRGDFSLRLYNVTPRDEQNFTCLVFWQLKNVLNVTVTLHVAANYSMPVVSAPSSPHLGEELTITCQSTNGYPRPNVYWINRTDNSVLDPALQNSTVSLNARGLYDVVSVLRVQWAPNVDVGCCIENVLLLQNLTVSSRTDTDTLRGTKGSMTESPGDAHEGQTDVVVAVLALCMAAVAVAVGWACRTKCRRHRSYAGAEAARRELERADHV